MEASDIKKLKDLEEENRRLKQMFADLSLERRTLKDVIEKKALKTAVKQELVNYLIEQYSMSIRHACRALSLSRTVYFYKPDSVDKTSQKRADLPSHTETAQILRPFDKEIPPSGMI